MVCTVYIVRENRLFNKFGYWSCRHKLPFPWHLHSKSWDHGKYGTTSHQSTTTENTYNVKRENVIQYVTLNSSSRRPNCNFFISLLSRPVNSGGRVTWSLAGEPCHAPFVDTQVSWDFCDVWRLNDCQITGLKNEIMEEITCLLLTF